MPLLQLDHVTKRLGGIVAADDVSFAIEAGTLTALIGPNGAGKSTIFNLISGFMTPTAGRIVFDGTDVTALAQHEIAALGLVRTYQLVQLFANLTVAENVHVGFHLRTRGGALAALVRRRWFRDQEQEIRRKTLDILASVGLAAVADERAGQLSYGRQRLLEVARALAAGPKLVLLDEPAAGLNPQETAALADLVRRINESGVTVLVVEHDMTMVMQLASRIVVLDSGRKIAEGTPDEIRRDPQVIAAYLGTTVDHG
jgi:branched-chain amino acid transport system ATP-binding protein